jgi:inner membrane protein
LDSITQAALGAAIGEATLGPKLGYKAVLLGAAVATLPDLDVVFNPLLDQVEQLGWHRGYSHSLLFVVAASPVFGWLFNRIGKRDVGFRRYTWFSFLCLFTAIVLDSFTVYGTQLFLPFSNYPVGFNNLSIIDPIVTLPLVIGVIVALFLKRGSRRRRIANWTGLAIVSVYVLLFTPAVKLVVGHYFEKSLESRHITYSRHMSAPTLMNSILWRLTAEVDDGYWIGYFSLFDRSKEIEISFVPRNGDLLEPIRETPEVEKLIWFSQGWYHVRAEADTIYFSDLRFGELGFGSPESGNYVFTWELTPEPDGDGVEFFQIRPEIRDPGRAFEELITRIQGIE